MTDLDIRPIAGALGAELYGVDLSETLDDAAFAAVRQALHDHLVIFFRDQTFTPEQHLAFARRFGDIETHRYAKGLPSHPEILPVVKEAEDRAANFGGIWHSDVSFHEEPPMGQILYALDIPESGGDTIFVNMYRAYEALSDGMKRLLEGRKAIHTGERSYGPTDSEVTRRLDKFSRSMDVKMKDDAEAEVAHPVVRTHPETGRKSLYISAISIQRLEGMTHAESRPILDHLIAHAQRPEFTCRFRWRKHSVAFWDNRCTQHYALNDYHGQRREMHRVTVAGERPV
ncbi:MAG: taurine dioxygenase [Alphaproteobacteria bacterium]|nr:taurine dioxygenase [Alphaproteobacteria bacterium]